MKANCGYTTLVVPLAVQLERSVGALARGEAALASYEEE